ncbi:endo-1,4-beta-xylanase [Umezawaea sp. Da 62-37]|uniref:endo-1,4-beta-xylanase n=1 Tax=Umezawaea sp. Da 62-37 TaxID=3075927 RepID=UPI0028F7385C|nr:endo-1,4-beta-xylanase [Umezawaea sp. Da 62-37]WNV87398.1 endo-1,4-beta-xylanase [Umezawaea sp. Da 62-37]
MRRVLAGLLAAVTSAGLMTCGVTASAVADAPVTVVSSTFEDGTAQSWGARGGVATTVSAAAAHGGTRSLLVTNRTQTWEGPQLDLLDQVEQGTRYGMSVWVRLAEGEQPTRLRLSIERRTGDGTSYERVAGDSDVTADGWVNLTGSYTLASNADHLAAYVEGSSATASFHVDDFTLSYVPLPPIQTDIPALRDVVPFRHFGAAVEPAQLHGEHARLLERHFSSVTPGNQLKWDATEPSEGVFRFTDADTVVAWAKAHGKAIRGHTLVWHQQTPAWVFKDAAGADMTATPENKALLLSRVEAHIRAVVGRYGDDIGVWDVVNEVVDEGQPDGLRRSKWFEITGLDYIRTAFRVAHEVAPTATLVINDYNTNVPAKRDKLHDLVAGLLAEGVPIGAVGHQMHVNVQWPSAAETEEMITRFLPLGVDQQITEMDVSVYTDSGQSYPATPPAEVLLAQADRYRDLVAVFARHRDAISSVTLWGLADDDTWLDAFPVTRKDHPLLFDTRLRAKDAYWALVDPGRVGTVLPSATCEIAYETTARWPGNFLGSVRVTNPGPTPIDSWELAWTYAGDQRLTQLWNGVHTQTGASVSVRNASWNAAIPVGESRSFGFLGTGNEVNGNPTAFTLNNAVCRRT